MKHLVMAAVITALSVGISADVASAQKWQQRQEANRKAAEDWVSIKNDKRHTTVQLELSGQSGRFQALRIGTLSQPTRITRVRVTFRNGRERSFDINQTITRASPSQTIDFGRDRGVVVRKVDVDVYTTVDQPLGHLVAQGLIADDPDGYEVLASLRVKSSDRVIELDVGRNEGRIGKVKLRAWESPVFIGGAEIIYGNGQSERIRVRDRLNPGEATDVIDLIGRRGRFIRAVRLSVRQPNNSDTARIDLMGLENRRPRNRF